MEQIFAHDFYDALARASVRKMRELGIVHKLLLYGLKGDSDPFHELTNTCINRRSMQELRRNDVAKYLLIVAQISFGAGVSLVEEQHHLGIPLKEISSSEVTAALKRANVNACDGYHALISYLIKFSAAYAKDKMNRDDFIQKFILVIMRTGITASIVQKSMEIQRSKQSYTNMKPEELQDLAMGNYPFPIIVATVSKETKQGKGKWKKFIPTKLILPVALLLVVIVLFTQNPVSTNTHYQEISGDEYVFIDEKGTYHTSKSCVSISGSYVPRKAKTVDEQNACHNCAYKTKIQSTNKTAQKEEDTENLVTTKMEEPSIAKNDYGDDDVHEENPKTQDLSIGDIVYITPTGEKYHITQYCGNGTYYPITVEEALEDGYEPCSKCFDLE